MTASKKLQQFSLNTVFMLQAVHQLLAGSISKWHR